MILLVSSIAKSPACLACEQIYNICTNQLPANPSVEDIKSVLKSVSY